MAFVGDTPALVSVQHMVQHIAFSLGRGDDPEFNLERLRRDWPKLNSLSTFRMGAARFLADLDDDELAERLKSLPWVTDGEMWYYVPILLAYDSPEEVLKFLKRHDLGPSGESGRARVLALLPDQRDQARSLAKNLIQRSPAFNYRNGSLNTLLLLGEAELVRNLAAEHVDSSSMDMWYGKSIMQYLAGTGDPDAFLEGAAGLSLTSVDALFTLAMLELSQDRRDEALDVLRRCVATRAFHMDSYWWARAFVRSEEKGKPLLPKVN
jgi:hypothetical protein